MFLDNPEKISGLTDTLAVMKEAWCCKIGRCLRENNLGNRRKRENTSGNPGKTGDWVNRVRQIKKHESCVFFILSNKNDWYLYNRW